MALSPGDQLGPYSLVSRIGAGGMGEVWKARDTRLDRTVAIKFSTAQFSGRFEREARAIAALNHPNIAQLYDVGENYIVMEFVDGEPLRPTDSIRKLIDIAIQVASGLAAAHAAGFVHRDLKPDNILLSKDGRAKILDFGLARETTRPSSPGDATQTAAQTNPGTILGTVGYMSPEQVRGDTADHRSDIFSFGVVLYEMLAGQRPFHRATSVETMAAILREDVPDLPDSIPSGLRHIVTHALEKDPVRRFQSAQDMGFALRTLSSTSVVTPTAAPAGTRVTRRSWLAVGSAAGTLASAGIGYWFGRKTNPPSQPSYRQLTFRRGTVGRARFASDGETIVYNARWGDAATRVYFLTPGEASSREVDIEDLLLLAGVSSHNELAVILNGGILARVPGAGGAPRKLLENVLSADWSPDGRELAVARRIGSKTRIEYPVGKVLFESGEHSIDWIRLSPTGDAIAFTDLTSGFQLALLDPAGAQKSPAILASFSANYRTTSRPAWTPDGREVWIDSPLPLESGTIYGFDRTAKRRTVVTLPGQVMVESISPRGRLLFTSWRHHSGASGLAPGESTERDLSWAGRPTRPLLARDGSMVIFTNLIGSDPSVYWRRTDGTSAVRLCEGTAGAISPDNKWVQVFRSKPDANLLVPTGPGDNREVTIPGLTAITIVGWLPNDQGYVVFARQPDQSARGIFLWKASSGPPKSLSGPLSPTSPVLPFCDATAERCCAYSGAGRWMIFPTNGAPPVEVPGLERQELPLNFTSNGNAMFIARAEPDGLTHIFKLSLDTGQRIPFKDVRAPNGGRPDPWIAITPDGRSYVYFYTDSTSELFAADGLR